MISPKIIIIPGKTIDLEIKARWLNQKEIATRLDISEKHLIDLIKWDSSITSEMALKLEYVFGISMWMWLNMDRKYQEQKARLQEQEYLLQEKNIAKRYKPNTKHLFEMWYISSNKLIDLDLIKELKAFFSVSKLSSIYDIYKPLTPSFNQDVACYRKSEKFAFDEYSLFTFLRIWERDVLKQNAESFEKSDKKEVINKIKDLTKGSIPDIEKIKDILNKNGIYFSFLKSNLEKLPLSWLVRYYKDNPLLQITNRWKYADIFRFNLFHELGHIYKHLKKKNTFLDVSNGHTITLHNTNEDEANLFANDCLIDKNDYEFLKRNLTQEQALETAKKNNVHPWIVIARLAHDKLVDRKNVTEYRMKIE